MKLDRGRSVHSVHALALSHVSIVSHVPHLIALSHPSTHPHRYLKNPALLRQRGVARIGGVLLAGAPGAHMCDM